MPADQAAIPYLVTPGGRWVWRSSDASIKAGCPSVLAAAEVLFALALFYGLGSHLGWPLFVFTGAVAAPMLLLRSRESVDLGVEWLERSFNREQLMPAEKLLIFILAAVISGGLSYWLGTHWLSGHEGFALFWRSAVTGAVAVAFAFVGADVSAGADTGAVEFVGAVAGVFAVAVAFAFAGVGVGVFAFAFAGAFAGVFAGAVEIIFIIPLALGLLMSGTLLRITATLRCQPQGFRQLPQNWRETLWSIDLCHPPELMPDAGRVSSSFTVRGLWSLEIGESFDWFMKIIFIPAWYLPALAYRWSLKASAWLWFPLILALRTPQQQRNDAERRVQTAGSVQWFTHLATVTPALLILAWVLVSLLPGVTAWLALLPEDMAKKAEQLSQLLGALAPGIRLALCGTFAVLLLGVAAMASHIKAAYPNEIASAESRSKLDENERGLLDRMERSLEIWRSMLIANILLLGYALLFHWIHISQHRVWVEQWAAPWFWQWL